MKVIPIASAYAEPQTSFCKCLLLVDGPSSDPDVVAAITSLDQPLVVDGITYRPGVDFSDLVSASGLAVDNLDLTIIPDNDEALDADLMAGKWDNLRFMIFEVNFRDPDGGMNVLKRGTTGVAKVNDGTWSIELRSLKQALQQTFVQVTSKTCRYRLFSVRMPDGLCFVDPAPFTKTGTVDSSSGPRTFTDAARAEADDYFGEGSVLFTGGENEGYERKVKSFAAGVFVFSTPFPFAIGAGDTYSAQAGCRKRLTEDCIAKFDNVLNFGGEPHIVGIDSITADPEVGG